jgi:hypothetical protein
MAAVDAIRSSSKVSNNDLILCPLPNIIFHSQPMIITLVPRAQEAGTREMTVVWFFIEKCITNGRVFDTDF